MRTRQAAQKLMVAFLFLCTLVSLRPSEVEGVQKEETRKVLTTLSSLQIPFIENKGQLNDKNIAYHATISGGLIFITKDGHVAYSLSKHEAGKALGFAMQESFVGASIKAVKGERETRTKVNYFRGNDPSQWRKNISTYETVSLGEIYEGIELTLKASGNNVEKVFYIKPNVDPETIHVRMSSIKGLHVNEQGELEAETGCGVVKFSKPVAYQEYIGEKVYVDVAYTVRGNGYGFQVKDYDSSKELVIDPLLSATFLGGRVNDYAYSVAADSGGNIYVAGNTNSPDFPVTPGSFDRVYDQGEAFIAKFDAELHQLLAATFLGGSRGDTAYVVTVDRNGNVYVAGQTQSADFPVTTGAYDTTFGGTIGDGFIAKLDASLQHLLASTYLGGSIGFRDEVDSLAVDAMGNVYASGSTNASNFPVTQGAYSVTFGGGETDGFVAKFDADLRVLLASTFIGGNNTDMAYAIALARDGSGSVFVAGRTYSPNFPVTPGAFDTTYDGDEDGFVAKFDGDLRQLLASTFLNGDTRSDEWVNFLAIDAAGNVYAAGNTTSRNFPVTPGAYSTTYRGSGDVFISKLDTNLQQLLASTFLGGNQKDLIGGDSIWVSGCLALDASGNVYVTGTTYSTDFPTTPDAHDRMHNGGMTDAFVAKLDAGLQQLLYSTFLGGSAGDSAYSVVMSPNANTYVVGHTKSPDFPVTPGAFNTTYQVTYEDAFVARLDLSQGPPLAFPVPTGQLVFYYPPTEVPVRSTIPAQAKPMGVGSVAQGGHMLSLQIGFEQFAGPVDIYVAFYLPVIDPSTMYVLLPDGSIQSALGGFFPCLEDATYRMDASYGDMPVAGLPAGDYYLAIMVTPANRVDSFYLWVTSFTIP